MKKWDLWIILGAIVIALGGFFLVSGIKNTKESALFAVVVSDGAQVMRIDLNKPERIFIIEGEQGTNKLRIGNGSCQVLEASCPDHNCIAFGQLSKPSDFAACLPNKMVMTVEGNNGADGAVDTN